MTLQELSRLSGLSVAFLSQVERGVTTPSVMSLLQLSEALLVEMNYFVGATQGAKIFRRVSDPEYIEVESPITYIRLSNKFPEQKLEPFIFILQPGHQSSAATVGEGHEGEGFLYLLDGEVHAEYQGHKVVLRPGDSMHYDLSSPLALNNLAESAAKVLWVGSIIIFPTTGESRLKADPALT